MLHLIEVVLRFFYLLMIFKPERTDRIICVTVILLPV